MDDVFAAQLMSTDLRTVGPDTPVAEAADRMRAAGVSSVVVVEGDRLLGILTATDVVDIVARGEPTAETAVERYMTADVVTTDAQTPAREVADLMLDHGFHHLPVVDGETLIGMVSTTDLAAYVSTARTPSTA